MHVQDEETDFDIVIPDTYRSDVRGQIDLSIGTEEIDDIIAKAVAQTVHLSHHRTGGFTGNARIHHRLLPEHIKAVRCVSRIFWLTGIMLFCLERIK